LLEYNSFHSFSHWHDFKAMEEGVTPFVDDKEQSVNKEKLAAYLAPMPVWW